MDAARSGGRTRSQPAWPLRAARTAFNAGVNGSSAKTDWTARICDSDIVELCTFRILIEPKAAELAHGHDRDGALKALTAAVADMKQAVAARDTLAYGSADTAFHDALFVHCGNHYLMQSYQLIAGRVAALRTNLSSPLDVQTPASFDQHRELLDLFERGKFEGFTKLMIVHITNSGHAYARALEVA